MIARARSGPASPDAYAPITVLYAFATGSGFRVRLRNEAPLPWAVDMGRSRVVGLAGAETAFGGRRVLLPAFEERAIDLPFGPGDYERLDHGELIGRTRRLDLVLIEAGTAREAGVSIAATMVELEERAVERM